MGDCSCQGVRVTTSTLILVDSSELWRAERDAYERLLSLPVSPILFFPGPERPDSFPRLGKPISPAPSPWSEGVRLPSRRALSLVPQPSSP